MHMLKKTIYFCTSRTHHASLEMFVSSAPMRLKPHSASAAELCGRSSPCASWRDCKRTGLPASGRCDTHAGSHRGSEHRVRSPEAKVTPSVVSVTLEDLDLVLRRTKFLGGDRRLTEVLQARCALPRGESRVG